MLCPFEHSDYPPDPAEATAQLTATDKLSIVLLVNRYWMEAEERSAHILWVPGGSDLGEISDGDRENYPNELRPFCKPPTIGSDCLHVYVRQMTILQAR